MRLERKLTLAMLALFVPPTAGAGLILVFLYRGGFLDNPASLLAAVVLGLAAMMTYLALVAHGLGHSLVRTIEELRHGAELIATVNPEHRLRVRTGDELEVLGEEINRLADHLRVARGGVDEEVAHATRALRAERERLSAIIDRLSDAVIVANPEGRITLANRAARDLLRGGGPLLGQTLFDFVDREAIVERLARSGAATDADRFVVQAAGGAEVRGTVCAIFDDERARAGFLLTFRQSPDGSGDTTTGPSPAAPGPTRSELFDFSLFEEMERHVGPADRGHRLDELTFVVFDTETTGLEPEAGDRVISLAGVRVHGGRLRRHEAFDSLVDPERSVPAASVAIHGITDAMLIGAPPMATVLPAFLQFAGEAVLVGHEASFDLRFLEPEARRLGLPSLTARPILDTRLLSRSLHGPGEAHSLEAVATRLGVTVTARHSALGDALTTAEILVRLLALLNKRGVRTLGEILDAVRGARRITV